MEAQYATEGRRYASLTSYLYTWQRYEAVGMRSRTVFINAASAPCLDRAELRDDCLKHQAAQPRRALAPSSKSPNTSALGVKPPQEVQAAKQQGNQTWVEYHAWSQLRKEQWKVGLRQPRLFLQTSFMMRWQQLYIAQFASKLIHA